jgi:hypothetical protein
MATEKSVKPQESAAFVLRMLKLARPELRNIVLGTFFLAVGSLMGLLFPQAIRLIVDDALGSKKSGWSLDQAAAGPHPRAGASALGRRSLTLRNGLRARLRSDAASMTDDG